MTGVAREIEILNVAILRGIIVPRVALPMGHFTEDGVFH
jgi:hypothetical protein